VFLFVVLDQGPVLGSVMVGLLLFYYPFSGTISSHVCRLLMHWSVAQELSVLAIDPCFIV
jgi:hypothetical protein